MFHDLSLMSNADYLSLKFPAFSVARPFFSTLITAPRNEALPLCPEVTSGLGSVWLGALWPRQTNRTGFGYAVFFFLNSNCFHIGDGHQLEPGKKKLFFPSKTRS